MLVVRVNTFDEWRAAARNVLARSIPPDELEFRCSQDQPGLFDQEWSVEPVSPHTAPTPLFPVPQAFLEVGRTAACHRSVDRFQLLYRVLWRLTHGERELLEIITDDDVHHLLRRKEAVRRDVHKTKAFVRFRRIENERGQETFIAWHRPDHYVLSLAAPFFARRFPAMTWAIFTPDESVVWDKQQLVYGAGIASSAAPSPDELEGLWRTYYASIFNPARINVKMMKREMPVRHWNTLPEAELIPELLAAAPTRVQHMIDRFEGHARTAADYLPSEPAASLEELRAAAAHCQGCDLYRDATQTVFGEGPVQARIMFIGEQPGDQEDLAGRPFVGPAGTILEEALRCAGINRSEVYVTNVVKHFHYEQRGKRRLHKKPTVRQTTACLPWLAAEAVLVRPEVIVCLGATAAQSVIGRDIRLTRQRGEWRATRWCSHTLATYHPSAVLRAPDAARRAAVYDALAGDLKRVAQHLQQSRRD